ncbi:MAG: (Fe-S)-binding protein [Deltaproteobacteria bacterium]|nr:(Fe-S)-binding protein [Deltaproteobacteria bacterium]
MTYEELARSTGMEQCVDCARCTNRCPVATVDRRFDLSKLASAALAGSLDGPAATYTLWRCLACGACLDACPGPAPRLGVFMLACRTLARQDGYDPPLPYWGAMAEAQELSVQPAAEEPSDANEPCEAVLVTGGAVWWDDIVDRHLGVAAKQDIDAATALLRAAGIDAHVLDHEPDSGADLAWIGDAQGFVRHVSALTDALLQSGAKSVITLDRETHRALTEGISARGIDFDLPVHHIADVLAQAITEGRIALLETDRTIAVYEEPAPTHTNFGSDPAEASAKPTWSLAALMELVPGLKTVDLSGPDRPDPNADGPMPKQKRGAPPTCGIRGFSVCAPFAARLQERLLQAVTQVDATVLVAPDPTSAAHLRCAAKEGAWARSRISVFTPAQFLLDHIAPQVQE